MAAAKPRLGLRTLTARGPADAKTPAGGTAKGKTGGATTGAAKTGAPQGATPPPANTAKAKAARAATPARAKSGADAARPVGSGPAARKAAPARNAAARTTTVSARPEPEPDAVTYDYPAPWLRWVTFALALAGLGVSIYLTYSHYTESALAGCTETTGVVNCGKVTTSPQSVVFGIPVAVLGLAFYVFTVAIMSPWAWKAHRREVGMLRLASLIAGIGFVLYLIYAELFDIGSICLYCTSVHVITFALFVLTGLAVAVWGFSPRALVPPPRPTR